MGSLKSSKFGGSTAEVAFEDLSAQAKAAGWKLDPLKLGATAGEAKPLMVSLAVGANCSGNGGIVGGLGHSDV